jgi:hypothetical protein
MRNYFREGYEDGDIYGSRSYDRGQPNAFNNALPLAPVRAPEAPAVSNAFRPRDAGWGGNVIDVQNNPYFGTAGGPNAMGNFESVGSLGSGNGRGFADLAALSDQSFDRGFFAGGDSEQDYGIDPARLQQVLDAEGIQIYEEMLPGNAVRRYLVNRNGELVGQPVEGSMDDDNFGIAAGIMAAVVTAGVASWANAGGAAAGAATSSAAPVWNAALAESAVGTAGYGASSAGLGGGAGALAGAGAAEVGTLGSIPSAPGYVPPLETVGTIASPTANLPSLAQLGPAVATPGIGTLGQMAGGAATSAVPGLDATPTPQVTAPQVTETIPSLNAPVLPAGAAMNAAQAESASRTPGYGPSSAGPGGSPGSPSFDLGGWEKLISPGLQVGSALFQQDSLNKANESLERSNAAQLAEIRRQYDLTREDTRVQRELGIEGMRTARDMTARAPTAAEVMAEPGYQFGLDQGMVGLDRQRARSGGRVSGEALTSAAKYAGDYATGRYDNSWRRRNDTIQQNLQLAGLGGNATTTAVNAGGNSSSQLVNAFARNGESQAASSLARGNVWGNLLNQGASWWNNRDQPRP